MSECEEVASSMPALPVGSTMDDARRYVRLMMPGESVTVVDNVAWSLWTRSKEERNATP